MVNEILNFKKLMDDEEDLSKYDPAHPGRFNSISCRCPSGAKLGGGPNYHFFVGNFLFRIP